MSKTPQDRLPPHDGESELGFIGCLLLSPNDCITEALEAGAVPDWFYDLRARKMFSMLVQMQSEMKPIDISTIFPQLKLDKESAAMIAFTLSAQDATPSAANLSYFLKIVREKFLLRKIIQTCAEVSERANQAEGNVLELLDVVERDILAIRPGQTNESDIKALVRQATDMIEAKCMRPNEISGMSTGLALLDKISDGIHPGESVILAGFPSTGKTSLAMNIVEHNALKGIPCAVFSAETKPSRLILRSICSTSKVNFRHVTMHDVPKMTVAASRIAKAPIHIQEANGQSIGQVIATARRLVQQFGIKLFVIDYLQLLSGIGDNREQVISNISKGIKSIAMEHNVPVLCLSQLNDDGKLRESRSIGQDADSVWKLENDGDRQPLIQPIKLNVDKSRDGEIGSVPLIFFKETTRFESKSQFSDEDFQR